VTWGALSYFEARRISYDPRAFLTLDKVASPDGWHVATVNVVNPWDRPVVLASINLVTPISGRLRHARATSAGVRLLEINEVVPPDPSGQSGVEHAVADIGVFFPPDYRGKLELSYRFSGVEWQANYYEVTTEMVLPSR
jgi:hypothetical protein